MRARSRLSGKPPRARGAVLLGVLVIMLTISMIGATLASFFFSVTTVAEAELSRAQALYLAEAGLAYAVAQIRLTGQLGGAAQVQTPPTRLGDGEYEVLHDASEGLITSIGTVRGVRRTVQVKYQPF